ncbi:hypothetical protein BH10PSE12_BH10PSE12_01710 [soil metagenome]
MHCAAKHRHCFCLVGLQLRTADKRVRRHSIIGSADNMLGLHLPCEKPRPVTIERGHLRAACHRIDLDPTGQAWSQLMRMRQSQVGQIQHMRAIMAALGGIGEADRRFDGQSDQPLQGDGRGRASDPGYADAVGRDARDHGVIMGNDHFDVVEIILQFGGRQTGVEDDPQCSSIGACHHILCFRSLAGRWSMKATHRLIICIQHGSA